MNKDDVNRLIIEHALGYTNEVTGLIMSIFKAAYDGSLTPAERAGRLKELMNDIEHASTHSQEAMQTYHDMHRRCILNETSI